MVTSNTESLPSNIKFIYNKSRLNIVVSCAQYLTIAFINPKLLEIPCGTVEQMKRVNTLYWLSM